jgi:orotate phosphoribosyltransferase
MADALGDAGLLGSDEVGPFVRAGHFAYESGDHGDTWLALELLFADPRRLQRAAARLAERLRPYGAELVCAPLVGGALVGQWVAHELNAAYVFAEAEAEAGARYRVPPGMRAALADRTVVVVDDAINAGSATGACVREVQSWGGRVAALGSLIVRDSAAADLSSRLGVPLEALLAIPWSVWPAAECPRCRSGTPLD